LKRKNSSNQGFSLVELLIAIVILGIVVTPLLQTFVTSAGTAARSRKLGDATLAAQNVAESIEAASLSDLLNNPSDALHGVSAGFYTYDGTGYTVDASTQSYRADSYHIGVTGITSGSTEFSAMATLSADSGYAAINDIPVTNYSAMDAVYAQPIVHGSDDVDTRSWDAFEQHLLTIDGSYNRGSAVISREIILDTTETDGKLSAELTYRYQYRYTYEKHLYDAGGGLLDATETVRGSFEEADTHMSLFPQGFDLSGGKTPDIYLLYYPWYTQRGQTADLITVYNRSNIPFTLFLVKQRDPSLSDTELAGAENQYRAQIDLRQTCAPNAGATILSNAAVKLDDETSIATVRFNIYRSTYVSYTGNLSGTLVDKTSRNRLYQVTVDLYPAGSDFSGDPIYSFHTTKLQ